MKQKIIVTALPNGINTRGGGWHISAAIGLQVEDVDTTLANVKDMLNWAPRIKDAKFIVQVNGVSVPAKVSTNPAIDTKLWENLFTPTVKVKSFVQEDLSKIPIASYPVKHILDYIKFISTAAGKNPDPNMPTADKFTENPGLTALSDYTVGELPKSRRVKPTMGSLVNKKRTYVKIKDQLKQQKAIPFSPTANPESDFTQLKNFHGVYDLKEIPVYVPMVPPDFEFHSVLAALSTHPQLLRRLGLVIDLEIDGPAAITKVITSPNIRVIPYNINFDTPTRFVCAATAYTKTTAGFYAKPLDGSSIDKGHLKINGDGYTVFQMDTDGSALKMCQQMDALLLKKAKHIFHAWEGELTDATQIPFYNNEAPRREGLPSHRTSGIAIAKNGRATQLNASFTRMNDWKAKLMTGNPKPGDATNTNAEYVLTNDLLFADDVNLGFRMDIMPAGGVWYSLHKRNNRYSYMKGGTEVDIPDIKMDEGFIQTAASEEQTDSGPQLKVGETFARWEGWSLSVPRPGSSLNDPITPGTAPQVYDPNTQSAQEEAKYKAAGSVTFKLNVRPMIEKGSLPMLRFGRKYSIRVRTVDMAGNSVPLETKPESPELAVVSNIQYMRYEPVDAPSLVMGTAIKDGESSQVLVIRSNEGIPPAAYETANKDSKHSSPLSPQSIRHVKPPRSTIEMSTQHSMLDKGMGQANNATAINIFNKIKNEKDPKVDELNKQYTMAVVDGNQQIINVEYLIDPMAAGVTFYISPNDPNLPVGDPEKAYTRQISFYDDAEITDPANANGLDISYDTWMQPRTFRIIVREPVGTELAGIEWKKDIRALEFRMPKSITLKLNYACFWRPKDLVDYSGMMKMIGINSFADDIGKRIAKGKHWMFSPFREITVVHAVQQPLTRNDAGTILPAIPKIFVDRDFGDTFASIDASFLIHPTSTDKLDFEGEWTEWVDDVSHVEIEVNDWNDDVQRTPTKGKVHNFTTQYNNGTYNFGEKVEKGNPVKSIQHKFNDTKHRRVIYKSIATTRYREYFFQLIKDKGTAFPLTRESVKTAELIIPSSVRPVAPQVEYVIPTFEWSRQGGGGQAASVRMSGLRVYLRRPWYNTGQGEQLAVVLYININDNLRSGNLPVSEWGTDPTKTSGPISGGPRPNFDVFTAVKTDNVKMGLSTVESDKWRVGIVAYDVKYDKDRQLYYADIMMNVQNAYFPFIRLCVARFQRNSVLKGDKECCLSAIVQTDFIQVPPPRLAAMKLGSSKNQVTVSLSGTVPNVSSAPLYRNKIQFVIENIDHPSSEDTHFSIAPHVQDYSYTLQGSDIGNFTFTHQHTFNLPSEYASKPYRIKVLEFELITYDPMKPNPNPGGVNFGSMPMMDRLVFAEVYVVNG